MINLFKYFVISLLFMLLGFVAGLFLIPESIVTMANLILTFFLLGLLIFTLFFKRKRKGKVSFPMYWVYIFTFIDGILLYPTLVYYAKSLGLVLFFNIVLSTIFIFSILSLIAARQPSGKFLKLGKILFIGLLVIILMTIINIFLRIAILDILLSILGIIIFSAYILYDVNTFKTMLEHNHIENKNDYSIFVLNLYLDFINLLLDILDLFDN